MQCPQCGADVEDREQPCPECGVSLAPWREIPPADGGGHSGEKADAPRSPGATTYLTLAALFATMTVMVVLFKFAPALQPAPRKPTTVVVEKESATPEEEQELIEKVIDRFYRAATANDTATIEALVFPGARGGRRLRLEEATAPVVYTVTHADIGSGTADLLGKESRAFFGKRGGEMEFTLQRADSGWMLTSWDPAETLLQSTIPEKVRLNDVTSLDVVRTLLDARRENDVTTMRLLTTSEFQLRNQSWFDESAEAEGEYLKSHKVGKATASKHRYSVRVDERWDSGRHDVVYTVIKDGEDILVDTRSVR